MFCIDFERFTPMVLKNVHLRKTLEGSKTSRGCHAGLYKGHIISENQLWTTVLTADMKF